MNPILRNFMSIVRRYKLAMSLNIVGLAAAFAAFIIISMQIRYEQGFESCHPKASRIYRADLATENGTNPILVRPFVYSIIHSSPLIETGTILNPYSQNMYITVERDNKEIGFKELIMTCYPEITEMFNFQMVEGRADCLKENNQLLLPESLARKFFGTESAVGKQVYIKDGIIWTKGKYKYLTVGGVYKDFPGNTQLNNTIYTAMGDDFTKDDWQSSNYYCYILLKPGVSPEQVEENFKRSLDFKLLSWLNGASVTLKPISSLYYLNESPDGRIMKGGDRQTTNLLIGVAFLVIVIACINFTNIYMALVPIRIRSINTQKVLGSSSNHLRMTLVAEAMLTSFLAFLLSLVIVFYLQDFHLLDFVKADVRFSSHIPLLIGVGLLSLLLGLVAGLYPSYYTTSFAPALVLKGSFGLSSAGKKLRTVLISVQFIISMALIIGTGFVYLQNHYMRHIAFGFNTDQIAVVELDKSLLKKSKDAYVEELKSYPEIEDVCFSSQVMGERDGYMTWGLTHKDQQFGMQVFPVSWNFFKVMGIKLTEGNMPTEADEKGNDLIFYGYKNLQEELQAQVGDRLEKSFFQDYDRTYFAGFTENIQFSSARVKDNYAVFVINDRRDFMGVTYIRIKAGADIEQAVKHIQQAVAHIDPTFPINIKFYDKIFDQLYQQEENMKQMITLFSALAILLSLVGVFSLVMFEAVYRRKEIGIRRVMGSSIREILMMLSRSYINIILVCFVIAAPVAYYGVSKWLESFAIKTPIHLWVFIVALAIVLLVTLATVIYQSWHAATSNPVNSIRNE